MVVAAHRCFQNNSELRSAAHNVFTNASDFNSISSRYGPIVGDWCVEYVTDFSLVFAGIQNFTLSKNQNGTSVVQNWITSAATKMSGMFRDSSFNQPVDHFVTSRVTDFSFAFQGTSEFNQTLNWDTSSATNMAGMFQDAIAFQLPLSQFVVDRVTNFSTMFENSVFNSDISNWNVTSAQDMTRMFYNATLFQQDLCDWGFLLSNGALLLNPSDPLISNMFNGTACPDPNATDFNIAPPSPLCFTCSLPPATMFPTVAPPEIYVVQVLGNGFMDNLTNSVRPVVENLVLHTIRKNFGKYDLLLPGENTTAIATPNHRRLIKIRTCPKNCQSISNKAICVYLSCIVKAAGRGRRLLAQQQPDCAAPFDPVETEAEMNDALVPVKQTCKISLLAGLNLLSDMSHHHHGGSGGPPTKPPKIKLVVTCPGLSNFPTTSAPTISPAPSYAPCPTSAPTSGINHQYIHACYAKTRKRCLCRHYHGMQCAERTIKSCKSSPGIIGEKEKKRVKQRFIRKTKKRCKKKH